MEGAFCMPDANGIGNGTPIHAAPARPGLVSRELSAAPTVPFVISMEASEPPIMSSASVFATWRSASRSACTYCFMVKATSAWPMRWLAPSSRSSRLQERQGRVARVVQGDPPQPGPPEQAAELIGVPLRMDGSPGLVRDHILASLVPGQPGEPGPVRRARGRAVSGESR